jgi:hypothetical protein
MNSVRKLSEPSPRRPQQFPGKKNNPQKKQKKTLQLLIPHLKAHI